MKDVEVVEVGRNEEVILFDVKTIYGTACVRLGYVTEPKDLRAVMPSGQAYETTLVSLATDDEKGGEQERRDTLYRIAQFAVRCFAEESRKLN